MTTELQLGSTLLLSFLDQPEMVALREEVVALREALEQSEESLKENTENQQDLMQVAEKMHCISKTAVHPCN